MNVRVVAKTAPVRSQIESRLAVGFDMFEVQLLDVGFSLKEAYNVLSSYGHQIDIRNIHTSLTADGHDVIVSDLIFDTRARESFFRTCELASQFAYEHPVEVILHNDLAGGYLESHPDYLKLLVEVFKNALSFDGVNIGIENTVGVTSHGGRISFREGTEPTDTPNVVRFLRDVFQTDRFGFVFDIGHYAIMRKLIRFLTDSCFREYVSNPDLEEIWEGSRDVLSTVHVSAIQGFGYGVDHGKPFYEWEPRDRAFLKRILTLYEETPNRPCFVVEVKETDYDKCWNLEHTANAIETTLREMHPDSLLGSVQAEKVLVYPDDNGYTKGQNVIVSSSFVVEE